MADLRRLGKRGSYRLGSSRDRIGPGWWLVIVLAGTLVIAGGAELGLWFVPFVVGLAVGLLLARAGWRLRHTLPAVLVMALLGWGVPLYWPAVVQGQPVGATARVIAALAGVPPHAVFGVVFTLLVGVLQAVVGLWLGRALTPRAPSR
jgi:hypothetical protein